VETVRPERHTVRREVGAPGHLHAFETTSLYANVQGYVKNWSVNIGEEVKKGQVLAEVVVPELEAQLRQKRAAVEQAVAKHKQAAAAVKVAEANVVGAKAKLDEMRAGVSRAGRPSSNASSNFSRRGCRPGVFSTKPSINFARRKHRRERCRPACEPPKSG
jgi:multidrug efflux pump subunit AcrA (membrane-fusion protein)